MDWPVEHEFEVELPATDERSAHRARLQLRYGEVVMKKSEVRIKKKSLSLGAVGWYMFVRWLKQQKPVSWVLMTSHPIQSPADALQIVNYYKQRWNVDRIAEATVIQSSKNQMFTF